MGARDDLVQLFGEVGEVEMAMAIDEHFGKPEHGRWRKMRGVPRLSPGGGHVNRSCEVLENAPQIRGFPPHLKECCAKSGKFEPAHSGDDKPKQLHSRNRTNAGRRAW